MSFIVWDPALETGNEEIDAQHRMIFDLADKFMAVCELECDDHERIADAMYDLADYVVEHFADEEQFMERCGYPQIGPHRALHKHLATRTLSYVAAYVNGEEVSHEELAPFITNWLREHILGEDLRMVRFARGE